MRQLKTVWPDGSAADVIAAAARSLSLWGHSLTIENEYDKQRGAWTDPALGKTIVAEWCEQWWATTADLRPSTRVRTRGILDQILQMKIAAPRLIACC